MAPQIRNIGGPDMAPDSPQAVAGPSPGSGQQRPVLAVVKDLFFVARIRETARLAGVPLAIARSADEVEAGVTGPRLLLLDLTTGFDYARIFDAAERAGVPVLAFTTHALARETQPWHARCARVVTKETLTAELPSLLREGVAP
ncbi:MAG: hypothetical protein AUH30_13585 [Candidatus Rokubacteria bacterium 13_1_40CM_68_15]|nr:MAG: hypothetical protein AUH30_13585 [Candidatus Rokubacteria bacterium 13_1_40CM_68_15]